MKALSRPSCRVRLALLASAAVLGVVGGCGGKSPVADSSTDQPGGSAASTDAPVFTNPPESSTLAPTPGGTLTVGVEAESPGWNPTTDPWANAGHNVARTIFDPLATFDASGKVVPFLASSISANSESTVWTIVLREGITFHNGDPLDAAAVEANFAAVKNSPQYSGQLALLDSMKVVDDLTLELTMSEPWSTFPNSLVGSVGSQIGYIAAPAMLDSPDGSRNPIGTGPFKFVEWVPDDHLTVERNDEYWQRPAWLDSVVFKPIPDSTARKAAMDAGDIDVYYTGSSSEIVEYQALQAEGKINVTIGSPGEPDCLMFNLAKAPLDDIRIRRAIVMATDMSRIFDYLDATGVKQLTDGPYASSSYWYAESNYPDFDPVGAKALVDEYVAEKGLPVEFEYAGGQDPFIVGLMELYQSMWAEVGMKANIVSRAQPENIGNVIGGNFQVVMWGGVGGGDPDDDYGDFHSGTGLNFNGFNDPAVDAALDAGRSLSDPAARKEQYAIVQKALGEAVPYLWAGTNQYGVVAKVTAFGFGSFELPDGSEGLAISGGIFNVKDVWIQQ